MLTLSTGDLKRDCEGISRRSFIRVGSLGLGGLSLPALLSAQAAGGAYGKMVRDKTVVVLFLSGGATHVETFDPKMSAVAEYRSMTGEVKTTIPGVTFGSDFSRMAARADQLAVVRSFRHGSSSHGAGRVKVLTADNRLKASMGSLYARIAGSAHPKTGLPNFTNVTPAAIDAKKFNIRDSIGTANAPGQLGPTFAAFDPSAGGEVVDNMRLRMPVDRLGERRALLDQLDSIKRDPRVSETLAGADKFQQQAFDVVLGGAASAFDLSGESAATHQRYDTSKFKDRHAAALGPQMLMTRRLCEAGCGFVTVSTGGWDMHKNLVPSLKERGGAVDIAVSAFLDDLAERGMSEQVLLVVTGEFGRTPRINKNAGRDHWGNLCTLALAGGGLPMGQVIGSSNETASVPSSEPVTVGNLMSTVMHSLVDPGLVRLESDIPQEVNRLLAEHAPIPGLS